MSKKIDIVFRSENGRQKYQLASGYISETTILFENEKVIAAIEAKGTVEFFDAEGRPIAAGKVSADIGGRAVYEDIFCQAQPGRILLQFPIYEWIDNYPNCDGEHDRWDTRTIGFHDLTLDLSTGTIV